MAKKVKKAGKKTAKVAPKGKMGMKGKMGKGC